MPITTLAGDHDEAAFDADRPMSRLPVPSDTARAPWSEPADWTLRRNCSLSPAGLAMALGMVAAVSMAISAFFWFQGAWLILPFAAAEVAALGGAFVWYARHALDGERLWWRDGCLWVEWRRGGRVECRRLEGCWLRLESSDPRKPLCLKSGTRAHELGRHASASQRLHVGGEIRRVLGKFPRRTGS